MQSIYCLFLASAGTCGGCSNSYSITLGTIGQSSQPSTAGTYNGVCCDSNGFPIFLHESNGLYLYFNNLWIVSARISGDFIIAGFFDDGTTPLTNCPDDGGVLAWVVRNGPDPSDFIVDLAISVSSV